MGKWRQDWQGFKKAHPQFEKHKLFKNDIGPRMDAFENDVAAAKKQTKAVAEAIKALESMKIGDALAKYGRVVEEMELKGLQGIWNDFKTFPKDAERAGTALLAKARKIADRVIAKKIRFDS